MRYDHARSYIMRHARPLEAARWRYHFEGGSRSDVIDVLGGYRNPDGGFGHALEPDCWNPASSPIQTWAATRILREIGWDDPDHPLVRGIVSYLGGGDAFDGRLWARTIPSNDAHPCAPWWRHEDGPETSDNPTASLAGFIVRFAPKSGETAALGRRIASEAAARCAGGGGPLPMHTVACYVELYEHLVESGADDVVDLPAFERLLVRRIGEVLSRDSTRWATDYACKPSLFLSSRQSRFYAPFREIVEMERSFIEDAQEADGSWPITWAWPDHPDAWAVSRVWWKCEQIVRNMAYLKNTR